MAYLTINRPKALNALNLDLLKELISLLSKFDKEGVRALILQGAGEKAFVAGADIKQMSEMKPSEARDFASKGQEAFSLLEALPFPVISLIQGFALGGGLEMALSSDILIMEEEARIGLPEVSLGLFPGFGGTQRLTRRLGLSKAKEFIFTGAFLTASEALSLGLVNAVVPKSKLLEKAKSYVSLFEQKGPLAIAASKRLIQKTRSLSLEEGLKEELKEFENIFKTEDSKEGMQAFTQKRQAQFKGK